MAVITRTNAFYADLSNEIEVAKFPEDFADWLMEEGREQDARRFLLTVKNWQEVTPVYEQTIERVIEIAQEYAPVVDFSEEIRAPKTSFHEALALLRDIEQVDEPYLNDEPLPWDREAEIINRTLADTPVIATEPLTDLMDEREGWPLQEYPDVEVFVDDEDSVVSIALKAFLTLCRSGYEEGARRLLTDLRAWLLRLDYEQMLWIVWTYVTVRPEPGSRIARRWRV